MIDQETVAEARRALGHHLVAYREAAGLSRHQFEPRVQYSRSTIANVETGRLRNHRGRLALMRPRLPRIR